ncbi:MAG: hypothetical protein ACE5H8_14325 [Alphaproteobacteria bacterium]
MTRRIVALLIVLWLAACAQYSLVEPGKRKIGEAFTVEPAIAWSASAEGKLETWTVDGPALEAIHFVKALADGDPLLGPGRPEEKRPVFRKDMSESEVMEFLIDSIAASGIARVEASGLRPISFGAVPGFRFEFSYLSAEGLEMDGMAAGAIVDGKLYVIIYSGAHAYYYPKYMPEVERLIDSIEML